MIICVVGPTGVGKTGIAEDLAVKYDAIVVNCDAMQVYRELNIGTAKIKESQKKAKAHYLFDIVNPNEEYSVYDYQKDARRIIEEHKDENIIFVGGTGLYLKAALFNYEFDEYVEKNEYEEYSNEELIEMLKQTDFDGDIHVNNRRRLISKLNAPVNSGLKDELLYSDVYIIGLTAPKEEVYARINDKTDARIASGLLDEVKEVYKKYGKVKVLKRGICYKEPIAYMEGKLTYDEMVRLTKQLTRKYAKRQYTWFNHQMDVKWFDMDFNNTNNTLNEIISYIESNK